MFWPDTSRIPVPHLKLTMDFDQLRMFMEVARLGNFSRAAEKVLRSQPAVSAQIRQLEEEYGKKLFDRTSKRVRLTPAGEVLLEYARRLTDLRAESLQSISNLNGVPTGTLHIGANEATFLYVLPKVFAKYHQMYPQVRISVYRSFTPKVSQKIEDGAVDLGVLTTPVKSPSLEVVPIFRDQIQLMVGPASPLFNRRSVTLKEFAQQPLIVPRSGSIRKIMEKHLRPFREDLNITMELTSVVMIKRFVTAGFGVSLICPSFARDNIRRGEVKMLRVEGLELFRELALVYRRDRSLPLAALAFVEAARAELKA